MWTEIDNDTWYYRNNGIEGRVVTDFLPTIAGNLTYYKAFLIGHADLYYPCVKLEEAKAYIERISNRAGEIS